MNAHLVLPALEAELPQGTSSPPRAPRPTGAFPDSGGLPPVAYPTAAAGAAVPPGDQLYEAPSDAVPPAGTAPAPVGAGPTTADLAGTAPAGTANGTSGPATGAHGATGATGPSVGAAYAGSPAIGTAYTATGPATDTAHGATGAVGAAYRADGAVGTVYGATGPATDTAHGAGGPATGAGGAVGTAYGAGGSAISGHSAIGAAGASADAAYDALAVGTAYGVSGAAGMAYSVPAGVGRGASGGVPVAPAAARAGGVELGRSASAGASRRTGPSRPRSGRGGRAARWLGVPQIVCWQLAMIVAGLGLREPVAVKIVAGVTALLLLTGVSVRWGGQWLYQWIGHGIRFGLRRRSLRAATSTAEPVPVVPALLAKDTWTRAVQLDADAAGPAEAMTDAVADAGGLSAALWLPAGDGARIDALPSARDLLDVMEKQPVTMVAQTVLHTGTRPDEPARTWIAVRARRSADFADDADLEALLANGLRRVARRLDRLGIEAEPLTGQAFPDTLAALAHVSGGRDVLTEAWGACRTGPVTQVTYRLAGFGQLPHAAAGMFLDQVLHRPERVATTVAVTAWRSPGAPTRAGTVLRIAAVNGSALDQAARDSSRLAAEFGVRPERLDGRHRAGVLASLPLGHTTPGGYLS